MRRGWWKGAVARAGVALLVALLARLLFGASSAWQELVVSNAHPVLGSPETVLADYRTALLWAGVVGAALAFLPLRERDPLLAIWAAKVFVVLGFMLAYEGHYRALDSFGYYVRSTSPSFPDGDWMKSTENIGRLAWLQQQALPHSYHATKLTFALVGLAACWLLWRSASHVLGKDSLLLLLGISLFPSILFWSSILGKDPVVLLGIALLAWATVCFHERRYARGVLALALAGPILLLIRPWLLPIAAFPVMLPLLHAMWRQGRAARLGVLAASVGIFAGAVLLVRAIFKVRSVADIVLYIDSTSRAWAIGGSGRVVPNFHDVGDLVAYLPIGAFTSLFRPMLFEVSSSIFGIMAGMENLLFLLIVVAALWRARWADARHPLVVAAILYVVLWASLYAFISPQNLGSAFRFRMQSMPLALLVAAWFLRPDRAAGPSLWAGLARWAWKPVDLLVGRAARRASPLPEGPLRISVITPRFNISGVPLAQMRFAGALARAGHEVELLVGTVNAGFQMPSVDGVTVRVLGKPRVLAMFPEIVRHLRQRDPHVVFVAEDHLTAVTCAAALAARSRVRISGSSRVTPFDTYSQRAFTKRWGLKLLMRAVMPRANVLTCVSQDMVGQYRKVFWDPPHVCVYNVVVDAASVSRMREDVDEPWLADGRPVLVAAGSLVPWKGFDDLLRAIALVPKERDARLLLLGDGPLRADLERLVKELGIEDRVKLVGHVKNPLKYFARARVFVLSSHVEGMPNVLVEAMMCGCTPVSTNCPTGPRELLQEGKYGVLVPMRDPAALVRGIEQALDRPTPPALLAEAVRPFEEEAVLRRHFDLLRAPQRPALRTAPPPSDGAL